MKKIHCLSILCFATILLVSCQKEEPAPARETGILHVDIGMFIHVNEARSALKSTQQTESFKVIIYKADGTEAMVFEPASSMPDTIELETGDYYVAAHSDNDLPAAFENPYYYGISDIITIGGNTHQSVLIQCALANTMVSVVYSDNIQGSFSDYLTTVSSDLDSLLFVKDETRSGYFRTLPLDILVRLTYEKHGGEEVTKTVSGSIPEPQANKHYEIHVDASIDEGMISFQILLDSSEVLMEIVEIGGDTVIHPGDGIAYGDLLITEIMYDPSAMSDTDGEWFEIYNHSSAGVNLQNLVLERNGTNRHVITDSLILSPGSYFVFARTDSAAHATNQYVYGSAITLPNTGAVLSISNQDTQTGPGALIFSVDYSDAGFPSGSGVSIILGPSMFNAAEAILGSSWCISASEYGNGDLGTPGSANDPCQ